MTEHSAYYYDYDRNDPNRKNPFMELTVDEDGILNLPDDLLKEMGWKEGDELVWEECEGSFLLKKFNKDEYD